MATEVERDQRISGERNVDSRFQIQLEENGIGITCGVLSGWRHRSVASAPLRTTCIFTHK